MYVPAHFKEERVEAMHAHMRACGLATLVTLTAEGLVASHVPLLLDPDPGPFGTLRGHLARPNPQAKDADAAVQALVIFQGEEGYITPSYYATKRETGKVVPTWNYAAVHAYGPIRFFDEAEALLDVVTRLTDRHEAERAAPWAVSDAPADFVAGMLRGIVGFEIPIARLEGKVKMSQNRPAADRDGVIAGLAADGKPGLSEAVRAAAAG
ncbi:MAG: transcriptional regulator [Rhodospirillales bacterium 69-11]|nr:FMN-binding negative transcriptional regulator [Rhodospirillales bacterium]MBN8926599.1 FMN-binding negative transcriptional regulator [Rhodospirillales bacterium]OJW28884.1 MAG: transcriptional regulator [Rhodospirillales bacterium 69-11]